MVSSLGWPGAIENSHLFRLTPRTSAFLHGSHARRRTRLPWYYPQRLFSSRRDGSGHTGRYRRLWVEDLRLGFPERSLLSFDTAPPSGKFHHVIVIAGWLNQRRY